MDNAKTLISYPYCSWFYHDPSFESDHFQQIINNQIILNYFLFSPASDCPNKFMRLTTNFQMPADMKKQIMIVQSNNRMAISFITEVCTNFENWNIHFLKLLINFFPLILYISKCQNFQYILLSQALPILFSS